MKKIILSVFICIFLLTSTFTTAYATTNNLDSHFEIVYQDDSIIIESKLSINSPLTQTMTLSYSKSADRTYTVKSINGSVLATFTLHGTFNYDGTNVECTKASYSSSISNKEWLFSSRRAHKNSNKAIGSFILTCDKSSQTLSETITLTCSANGNIS